MMDTIRTIYKELFAVKFLHSNYEVPYIRLLNEDLAIKPDRETKYKLKSYIMDYRFLDNTFVCFIRCSLLNPPSNEPKVPYIIISDQTRFRFLISAGANFYNNTIIEAASSKKVYQFSNRDNAGINKFITKHEAGTDADDLKNAADLELDENCLGVIDIYSSGAVNSSYDLFSGSEMELKSPLYSLRFKNKF